MPKDSSPIPGDFVADHSLIRSIDFVARTGKARISRKCFKRLQAQLQAAEAACQQ